MNFNTRKWVKPGDLNPNGTLFGGRLLQWIDEELGIYAIIQLEIPRTVTKYMSEIDFVSSAKQGDIIEIGIIVLTFGNSSITLKCIVRNKLTHKVIIEIDKIIMVSLDKNGIPMKHGKTEVEYVANRLKE
jgi:acyl-CoA hydrolase